MGRKRERVGQWLVSFSTMVICLFVLFVPDGFAKVKLTDKLSLEADFRFRYEVDKANDLSASRDRARIRVRYGFLYELSKKVEFGLRFRSVANSAQSPHQNLGDLDSSSLSGSAPQQRSSPNFGLDRAYIRIRWLDNGFLWLGKNQAAIWQQAENYWDADYQAEGVALGYKFHFDDKSKLTLQGSYSLLVEDEFVGVLKDRAILPTQAMYERRFGGTILTMAAAAAPVVGSLGGTLTGGKTTYYLYSVQVRLTGLSIPVLTGYELYHGGSSKVGHQFVLRFRPVKKLEFRFFWNHIPVNSVPLQGAIVMDDSRFSSNYQGFQTGLWYTIFPGLQIDFRVLYQDTLDENLTTAMVPGLGSYVQRTGVTTRYQMNLNIRF